jgi:hypothetical protein
VLLVAVTLKVFVTFHVPVPVDVYEAEARAELPSEISLGIDVQAVETELESLLKARYVALFVKLVLEPPLSLYLIQFSPKSVRILLSHLW